MKNNSISAIRCIATCMIVCCHLMQGLNNELAFWFNVGVQIFLFMSGYLYGKKYISNSVDWYKKQYLKIMIPMWIVLTTVILAAVLFKKESISLISAGLSYLGAAGFGTLPELTHTWFITYILLCYLITPLLQQMQLKSKNKTWKFILDLGVVLAVLEILYLSRIINVSPQYLACYIVGYFVAKRESEKDDYSDRKRITVFITGLMLITLPVRLFVQYGNLSFKFAGWEIVKAQITEWHHSLLGASLFLIMLLIFEKKDLKENALIKYFDKYSYSIFLVHQIFILNTFSLLHITDYILINIVLIIVVICCMAMLLQFVDSWVRKVIWKKKVER